MPYAPEGNIHKAKIVFIGEAPGRNEILQGRPLVGASGYVFDECLQGAGLSRSDMYITNLFNFMVKKDEQKNIYDNENNVLWKSRSGLTEKGRIHVDRLRDEIEQTSANVLVPMGNPALEALTGFKTITKYRGSILPTSVKGKKCVPTVHPANALHGQYTNRYIIRSDFKRAKRESEFPEIRRPAYQFKLNPTFHDCIAFLDWLHEEKPLTAVDIEVAHRQVSRIGFSWKELTAISIPCGDAEWPAEQEEQLWLKIATVLEDPQGHWIFQNGIFDIQFLAIVHHVHVAGKIEDTMYGHHIIYPDFRSGLDYLTSLYTDQPYYKNMVRHGPVDKEDG